MARIPLNWEWAGRKPINKQKALTAKHCKCLILNGAPRKIRTPDLLIRSQSISRYRI